MPIQNPIQFLPGRRTLLAAGAGLAAWWSMRKSGAADITAKIEVVQIVPVSDTGVPQAPIKVAKVVKTDAEWRKLLTPLSFSVTRKADTEAPSETAAWHHNGKGLYRCICCDTPLYSSDTMFESGTGWPSFWQPIAKENVVETDDRSFGVLRTAVSCKRCDAHLGHVFDDGPRPTGLRYCMNAVAMRFVKLA
ncbi:MAG TPA: peptide-methionine (R)-S-oxide reductase MsrB [Rhodocyclaceae bacterium]|nr:peptide-methionine (R)-S-oxide reductase MsrB [Rhodocyclaceae bacterium]